MTIANKIIDRKLAIERAGNSEALANELLNMLISALPQHEAEITGALDKNDFVELGHAVHRIHGGAVQTGAKRLADACHKLETMVKTQQCNSDSITQSVKTLLNEIDLLKAEIISR